MGEVISLFPNPDNLRYLPGHAELAPHPPICGNHEVPPLPQGLVEGLDKLIAKGRIDEGQAIELLDSYLENDDDGIILNLDEDQPEPELPDPNQLTLF